MNNSQPNICIETDIEIPFHDVDVMEIAWHGHYVKYLEIARCKLLDHIDYNYPQMRDSGYAWPIIDLRIRYIGPCKFQQKIRIKATLDEWENRLRVKYIISDAITGKRITKAHTDQVAVDIKTGEMQLASPDVLLKKIGVL
ncbi:MAG: acyl-CoA thioesterase [Cellvibrionaceae bacterium]